MTLLMSNANQKCTFQSRLVFIFTKSMPRFWHILTTSIITSSNMAGNKNKKQKRIAKKQILKKGLQDWMAETALHGLKYLSSGTSILAKIVWVII